MSSHQTLAATLDNDFVKHKATYAFGGCLEAESVNLSASAKERRPVVPFIDNAAARLGLMAPGSDMKAALSPILTFFVKWSFIGPDKPKSSIPGEPSPAQPQDYHTADATNHHPFILCFHPLKTSTLSFTWRVVSLYLLLP